MTTDYTSRDYNSVKNVLTQRARSQLPEWSRGGSSDFAMLLVDLWAYVADIQNYYLDRAYTESFLSTATQSASVHSLAKLLGYIPNPRVAATATVYVYNSSTTAKTIPAGTMFVVPGTATSDPIYFTTTSDSPVASTTTNASPASVVVSEGRFVTETLTSNYSLGAGGVFVLSEKKVVPASITLTVGTTTFTHTNRLTNVAADAPSFTTVTESSDNTSVVLGNGINGAVPTQGSTILATYRVGVGSKGNVAANAITALDTTIPNIVFPDVTKSTVGVGGQDPESLSSIKANAPTLRRTQDRAVTLEDYKSLIKGFPGVAKAHALTSTTSGVVTVHYSGLPNLANFETRDSATALSLTTDFGTAGTEIHTYLSNHLTERSMLGVNVSRINTAINLVDVYLGFSRIEVSPGFIQSEVTANITTAIRALFTWDAVKFDQTIRASEIMAVALGVIGVAAGGVTLSNVSASSSGTSTADYVITPTTSTAIYLPVLRTIAYAGVTGGIT
jgi:hypothetical protein